MRTSKLFISALALSVAAIGISCDDENTIDGGGSIPVADGFYITKSGVNPVASQQLVPEKVEASGFGSQDRAGFFATYTFLEAGNYNVVSVLGQELNKTYGGAAEQVTITGSDCTLNTFTLVDEFTEDGAAFNVPSNGFYKVMYDVDTEDIVVYKIEKASIIGAATPAGWSHNANQELTFEGTPSATGVTLALDEVEIRPGEYKIRFNCRWGIERRIDPTVTQDDPTNGYVAFTNFGGTFAALAPGGSNFSLAEGADGVYSVSLEWTPEDGVEIAVTLVRSLDPITFDPSNYAWGIIGTGSPSGNWDNDVDLNYEGKSGNTYSWKGTFAVNGEFKFRTNNSWSFNKGIADVTFTGASTGNFNNVGGNFNATVAGTYVFIISTSDDGDTWTVNVNPPPAASPAK